MSDSPPSIIQLRRRAEAAFRDRFGREPTLAAVAPGRVNLIGEHTDYNDGLVLPMAIDRHLVAVAAPAAGERSTFVSLEMPGAGSFDVRDEPPAGTWWSTLAGLQVILGERGPRSAIDVVVTSEIGLGAGLSSSAALAVAGTHVIGAAQDVELDALERALACQRTEHEYGGRPCGIMDMYVSILGEAGHAVLIDCRDHRAEAMRLLPDDAWRWLVADTGVRHDNADGAYGQRRATCAAAARTLGLDSLRDATIAMLEHPDLDDVARRRAAHVVTENTRVLLVAQAMQQGEVEIVGDQLRAGHASLRDLYEVSCPELDVIVETAEMIRASGDVGGARMTGGGFGGSAIILCRAGAEDRVREAIGAAFAKRFDRVPSIKPVRAVDGARLL